MVLQRRHHSWAIQAKSSNGNSKRFDEKTYGFCNDITTFEPFKEKAQTEAQSMLMEKPTTFPTTSTRLSQSGKKLKAKLKAFRWKNAWVWSVWACREFGLYNTKGKTQLPAQRQPPRILVQPSLQTPRDGDHGYFDDRECNAYFGFVPTWKSN